MSLPKKQEKAKKPGAEHVCITWITLGLAQKHASCSAIRQIHFFFLLAFLQLGASRQAGTDSRLGQSFIQ
eukprot:scaffold261137_cov20-Tisochrysis_lutea.AAC.1